jgi:hypothetical protein
LSEYNDTFTKSLDAIDLLERESFGRACVVYAHRMKAQGLAVDGFGQEVQDEATLKIGGTE